MTKEKEKLKEFEKLINQGKRRCVCTEEYHCKTCKELRILQKAIDDEEEKSKIHNMNTKKTIVDVMICFILFIGLSAIYIEWINIGGTILILAFCVGWFKREITKLL